MNAKELIDKVVDKSLLKEDNNVSDWLVQVQMNTSKDGWDSSFGIPSFVLPSGILGIVSKNHAEKIARKIVDPLGVAKELHFSIEPYEPF